MEPPFPPGAYPQEDGTHFTIWSDHAETVDVVLFGAGDAEIGRQRLEAGQGGWHHVFVETVEPGARYGYRMTGRYEPSAGLWYDPAKLLVDPYALAVDRPFVQDPRLGQRGYDTAALVPKAIVTALPEPGFPEPPRFAPGGLIYEVAVRPFTMLHPDVPEAQRGTIAALGHPAVIAHLKKIGVAAIELMPIAAWIDERHLPPLWLRNGWGYNSVPFMALDPRIAPGGIGELQDAVERLHAAGIGVILDMVFNHSGESDAMGGTLSLRGIDGAAYFRMADGMLVNDTGCGNTLACEGAPMRRLILDTLRHFVINAGVDGFRFDLAPVLGRGAGGFDPQAPLFAAIAADPVLADRVMIAEPWDLGPGGYQLGNFPANWLEWNDRYRDDVRRFWRGDAHRLGDFVTRVAGSSDVFTGAATRSVSAVASHDGFALGDLVAYAVKHNEANGEGNRDGHDPNFSWNNGVEGPSDDPAIRDARRRDVKALLATVFATRGTIMLTAGDEFGRTQRGNNNAYCQDNAITWLDWANRDTDLEDFTAGLAALRARSPHLSDPAMLTGPDVAWLRPDGGHFEDADWHVPDAGAVAMRLNGVSVLFNRTDTAVAFADPPRTVPARSVAFVLDGAPA
ncbi:glycogen debranching protein GlgX [Sphingomonas sp. NFR15]|uniref:glycogen debranching protein GlgX n=1 Tax=Sphingomonas sp. NFR15 TaxID=1566282 RepID=UPI0008927968|nr:glycogen debranching protein GlgX [Sphingomonas sp. NFR15]SDA31442.1 glycogen operon protein [Sphingomonas sp. NFR15]